MTGAALICLDSLGQLDW